jgi:LemA protein
VRLKKTREDKMRKGTKIVLIIAAIVVGALLVLGIGLFSYITGTYNAMVRMDEGVKTAWAQVENQLQRRMDLIPNYVEIVKGYAKHEREVFIEVTNARAKVAGSVTPSQRIESNNQLTAALSRLLVVVERYPNLKANENFIRLQDELAGTENRIAVERMRYNEAVRAYNIYIRRFPNNFLAGIFGFTRAPLFEAPEEAKQPPKVKF